MKLKNIKSNIGQHVQPTMGKLTLFDVSFPTLMVSITPRTTCCYVWTTMNW